MDNRNIDFVARHYSKGRFDVQSAWRRMGLIGHQPFLKRYRVAAAIAFTVIISATAALLYKEYAPVETPQTTVTTPEPSPLAIVKVIDFEETPLPDVIERIEAVYSVKVGNLPEHSSEYKLSLHYEGTPVDLIDTINDILGTDMTVTEK